MGRIIRRTVTITITETWTIVWTVDNTSQAQATTIVQDQPKTQEEEDETILSAITTGVATAAQPNEVAAKPKTGSQPKPTRRPRLSPRFHWSCSAEDVS